MVLYWLCGILEDLGQPKIWISIFLYQLDQLYTTLHVLVGYIKQQKYYFVTFAIWIKPNRSLLVSKWNQHALLIGFEVKQKNASLLAELW